MFPIYQTFNPVFIFSLQEKILGVSQKKSAHISSKWFRGFKWGRTLVDAHLWYPDDWATPLQSLPSLGTCFPHWCASVLAGPSWDNEPRERILPVKPRLSATDAEAGDRGAGSSVICFYLGTWRYWWDEGTSAGSMDQVKILSDNERTIKRHTWNHQFELLIAAVIRLLVIYIKSTHRNIVSFV